MSRPRPPSSTAMPSEPARPLARPHRRPLSHLRHPAPCRHPPRPRRRAQRGTRRPPARAASRSPRRLRHHPARMTLATLCDAHAHSVARLLIVSRIRNSHICPDPAKPQCREGHPAHLVEPDRAHPLQQLHHLPSSRRRRPIQPAYLRRRAPLVRANPHRHAIALHAALAARARLRRLRRQPPPLR